MSDIGDRGTDSSDLSPAQRLDPPNTRLIDAGIATIHDMETLQDCTAYENTHQQRVPILRQLEERAREIRSQNDSTTLASYLSAPPGVEAPGR